MGAEGGEGGNLGVHLPGDTVGAVVAPPPPPPADDDGTEYGRRAEDLGGEWRDDLEVLGIPMYWVLEDGVVYPATGDVGDAMMISADV